MICGIKKYLFFLFFIAFYSQFAADDLKAQTAGINVDKAIELAQKLAIEGKYDVTRLVCQRVLQEAPNYTDAYLIIGNTYGWENKFDSARMYYYKVFEYDNGNLAAFDKLIQIEIWEGNGNGTVELANTALQFHPNNEELLLKKARGHIMLGDLYAAKKSLFILLNENPQNTEARDLYRTIARGVKQDIQVRENTVNTVVPLDSLFRQAQNYAWNEQFVPARQLINSIIDSRPDYNDAYTLLAQTYAWENDYTTARRIIQSMDLRATVNRNALLTAADVEMWSGNYNEALNLLDNYGLKYFPTDDEFLFKKADIYKEKGDIYRAKEIVFQQLTRNPGNAQAIQLYNELKGESAKVRKAYRSDFINENLEEGLDADSWITQARELAYEKKYIEAQSLCQRVLDVFPEDYEALYLMGTIQAWQGNYPGARLIYEGLINKYFDSYELIGSMVDLGVWEKNPQQALERVNYGLEIYPNDKEYLIKKANILRSMGDTDAANVIINQLLAQYPGDDDIRLFYSSSLRLIKLNAVSAEYTYNSYNLPRPRVWQMFSGKYYKSNDLGTLIAGLNYGLITSDTSALIDRSGVQFEIGAYPVFEEQKRYFHINYGFSPSPVFAMHRLSAHIYQEFIPTWEFAGGFSYSFFRNDFDTTSVFLFDAGINKYWGGGFMLGFSVTIAPTPLKLSQGYTVTARKFLQGVPDNWIQLSASAGVYPENPALYQNDLTLTPQGYLNSYSIFGSARHILNPKWIGRVLLGFQKQEYQSLQLRNNIIANVALIYLLKPTE